MKNQMDFGATLICALRNLVACRDGASEKFIKASLALRSWYRHEALAEKPELVVEHSEGVLEVFGGTRLVKTTAGLLQFTQQGEPQPLYWTEVSSLGHRLAQLARSAINREYLEKAKTLVTSQGFDGVLIEKLTSALDDVNHHVVTKMNVNWWRQKCTQADDARVLGRLIWDARILDKEVFGLATRVEGFKFTAIVYNLCVQHKEQLKARIAEAPHMAPWLLSESHSNTVLSVHETVWSDLKDKFVALGGTAQAWKWLCSQGYSWFRFISLDQLSVPFLNQIASMQLGKVPYHISFVSRLRSLRSRYSIGEPSRYFDVFKAAVVAHKKRKLKVADFEDYPLIFDYLENDHSISTKGATWASLMRKQQAWHRAQFQLEMAVRKESGQCLGWEPFTSNMSSGVLEAISLNNSDELWEEGAMMSHCVGGYDRHCFRNHSRIYSIRRDGNRVATLEVRKEQKTWVIGQLYGPGNKRITDESVTRFAKSVLAACKRTSEPNVALNQVLRAAKNKEKSPTQEELLAEFAGAEIPF